jgi:hypothetical protein
MSSGANLTDPQVAVLARQAVDLLDPDIAIYIEPRADNDPYRFGNRAWTAWPLIDGHRVFGMGVDASMAPAQALARMIDVLSGYSSQSSRFRSRPFPPCVTGHNHRAGVEVDSDEVVFRCPSTHEVVTRIRPAL